MKSKKRKVEILVISDVHLGTYGCHAKELLQYLQSIKPKIVILNGDIINICQFSKSYFPKSHMKSVAPPDVVGVIKSLKQKHLDKITGWLQSDDRVVVDYPDITTHVIDQVFEAAIAGPQPTLSFGKKITSLKHFGEASLRRIIMQAGA